jgi:hypothetical protein
MEQLIPEAAIEPTPEAAPEVPTVAEPKPEEKDPRLSNRLQILASKEKAIVRRQQQVKAQEQLIQEREAKLNEWEQFKSQASTNPLAALQALGLSYQELTDFVLNNEKPTPDLQVKALRDEIASFKKEQLDSQQRAQEEAKKRADEEFNQAIENFKSDVNAFITSHADEYELINLHESHDLVFATIEEHFNKTKKILSTKEASDLVEKYLEEQVEKTVTGTKKFQSKFSQALAQKEEAPAPAQSPKTLTNTMSSSAPSMLPAKTENDRMARALAALTQG